jgi:hypothetical protein
MNDLVQLISNQLHISIGEMVASITIIGIIFGWYLALSTKRESERVNMLNSLPILLVIFKTDKEDSIYLKNIGHSPATNIKFDNFYQPTYDDVITHTSKIMTLKFFKISILMPNEMKNIEGDVKRFGLMDKDDLKYKLINAEIPLQYHVRYQDLTGRRYITKLKIHNQNAEITLAPIKFNVLRRVLYFIQRCKEIISVNTFGRCQLREFVKIEKQKIMTLDS